MIDKIKLLGRKLSWHLTIYCPSIRLKGLRKTMNTPVRTGSILAEVLNRNLPYTRQNRQPLSPVYSIKMFYWLVI
jgi:hypothetical protein